jgi:hypothetical protein
MADTPIYREKITSNKTELLFITLTVLFLLLLLWRVDAAGLDGLASLFLVFAGVFLFYSLNFRTLLILLTTESLKLTFGIFTWTVPMNNIEDCRLDHLPTLMRLGGAGIHFMFIRGRYRASFNFLEYPRVVVAFRRKAGPVQDISFSTWEPEEVIRLIRETVKD